MSKRDQRDRIRFSYTAAGDAPVAKIFKFLGSGQAKIRQDRRRKERAIEAICAFLLPYALVGEKEDPAVIRKAAELSIRSLLRQIETICLDFNLEASLPFVHPSSSGLRPSEAVSVPAQSDPQPSASITVDCAEEKRPPGIYPEGIDVDVNELLGGLL